MAILLTEVCAKCGKAMTDAERGDYWYHSEREPNFRCLCVDCARMYCFYEPTSLVVMKRHFDIPGQPTLL